MMQTILRQAEFQVEPLKSIVNVGTSTAYQICVSQGRSLGTMGVLEDFTTDFADMEAKNEAIFKTECARTVDKKQFVSRIRRALATLGF